MNEDIPPLNSPERKAWEMNCLRRGLIWGKRELEEMGVPLYLQIPVKGQSRPLVIRVVSLTIDTGTTTVVTDMGQTLTYRFDEFHIGGGDR